MADITLSGDAMPPRVKLFGTLFLLFQLLFAANNYGPQRLPLLNLVFDKPFVGQRIVSTQSSGEAFDLRDVTSTTGLDDFRRSAIHHANPAYLEVMGGGIAVGDFDGDGREDVFFTSTAPLNSAMAPGSPSTLFRNLGDGTFEDATLSAGLSHLAGHPQGALFFDFNNNGWQDLYVAAYDGGQLFRNDGGVFIDITREAGLDLAGKCGSLPCYTSSVVAADYNKSGYLDLLLINHVNWDLNDPTQRGERNLFPVFFTPQASLLYRNNGDGTFTDVTEESGLDNKGGKGLAAVWLDVDRDGWPDVYIANDLSPNTLYLNNRDGTFREFSRPAGLNEIKSSMGLAAADVEHSGDFDLVVTNLRNTKLSFYSHLGGGLFDYMTDRNGLATSARVTGWGVEFIDLDMDGHQDLVIAGGAIWDPAWRDSDNLAFRNLGNGFFADVSRTSGDLVSRHPSRGLVYFDYDGDGYPDLLFSNLDGAPPLLLKNVPLTDNNWLNIRLEGTLSNRDAVGARVELTREDGLTMTQEVRAGGSYQSAGSRTLFFGLGDSSPERLRITWPSGHVEVLHNLPERQLMPILEGSETPTASR